MKIAEQLARHFKEVHFGPNWTWSNLKDTLDTVTWQQATTKIEGFNTIAALVYHINYFVQVTIPVFEGGKLEAHDKYSFDVPPINSEADWQKLLDKVWADAATFEKLITAIPDSLLWETFSEEKYGTYYRNIQGIIEHSHYHLGQIVILKKFLNKE
jgi:hypothetical protein